MNYLKPTEYSQSQHLHNIKPSLRAMQISSLLTRKPQVPISLSNTSKHFQEIQSTRRPKASPGTHIDNNMAVYRPLSEPRSPKLHYIYYAREKMTALARNEGFSWTRRLCGGGINFNNIYIQVVFVRMNVYGATIWSLTIKVSYK